MDNQRLSATPSGVNGQMAHRTIQCPLLDSLVLIWEGKWPISDHLTIILWTARCATGQSDARADREGWDIPNEAPTAPRPLGAIKGSPRRMKQHTKHTLSTLQLWDSTTTPLKCLREIWAHFLSRYFVALLLRSLLCICARCCCVVLLCAYSIPSLTLVLVVIIYVVTEPPKILDPPTDVLVLRTLDSHVGAPNSSIGPDSHISQERSFHITDITYHQSKSGKI
jgi:hypothetical protein